MSGAGQTTPLYIQDVLVSFTLGRQRPLSGGVSFQNGGFFSGDKTTLDFGLGGEKTRREPPVRA